jgi:hypothetical protein
MTGALEEFLRKLEQPKPKELWRILTGHPSSYDVEIYNRAFAKQHPEVSRLFDQMKPFPKDPRV